MAAREFRLPDLGEGLTEARVIAWLVSEGDTIGIDQPVAEVETAKAAVEVPSPYAGTVSMLHAGAGDLIDVGAVLVTISDDTAPSPADPDPFFAEPGLVTAPPPRQSEGASGNVLVGYGTREPGPPRRRGRRNSRRTDTSAPRATPAPAPRARSRTNPAGRAATSSVTAATTATTAVTVVAGPARVAVVSPLVRRLARDLGVDLASLTGTGHNGLIVRRDVERAPRTADVTAPTGTVAPAPAPAAVRVEDGDTFLAISPMQQAAAERFSRSRREIPEATVWVDVDATRLLEVRRLLNRDPERPAVSLIGLVARFCVAALAAHPPLNSTWDGEHGRLVTHHHVNLGVAAQTPRGLVVPVVRAADTMSARELSEALRALVERARAGSLTPADMTGGTFTLNNYGVFDVDGSAAIINPPEAAIVGLGRIMPRPWVVDGAVVAREVTELTLSFDHRVCDGGIAASFLRFIRDCVHEPATLLGEL